MLKKKLRKNADLFLFMLIVGIIYAGGWQAEVFGFIQRGILATGLMEARGEDEATTRATELNFQLYDAKVNIIHGSDLEGKTVFLNFWATWCPPCVAEMSGIQSLYEKLEKQDDIVFLMVSVDEDTEKARGFMHRKSFGFPLYFPASGFPESLEHQSIPATFVISPGGKVVYQREGMASYDNQEFADFLRTL